MSLRHVLKDILYKSDDQMIDWYGMAWTHHVLQKSLKVIPGNHHLRRARALTPRQKTWILKLFDGGWMSCETEKTNYGIGGDFFYYTWFVGICDRVQGVKFVCNWGAMWGLLGSLLNYLINMQISRKTNRPKYVGEHPLGWQASGHWGILSRSRHRTYGRGMKWKKRYLKSPYSC